MSDLGKCSFLLIWLNGFAVPLIIMVSFALRAPTKPVITQTSTWAFSACALLSLLGLCCSLTARFHRGDHTITTLFCTVFHLLGFLAGVGAVLALTYLPQRA